ncbi:MAG TPA: TonB-dependent receptor [Caldithrix abyssi]|uniref:TonB-dependent receptor n=1 Tax=Caldithrix abyssi TaxID=187145 RepID=A0A7V4U3Q0_CALAY|nr:TonB-dependent receptor [Caldithrix abyssi]
MRHRIHKFSATLLTVLLLYLQLPAAAGTVQGRLLDENDQPVAGANIYIEGTVLGAASSLDGSFTISGVPAGQFRLVISMVGYQEQSLKIKITEGQKLDLQTIVLKSVPLKSQPIVVTAGKYEQKVENVPVSISSVSRMEIEARNSITIDKALQYVSGVNMNGDQVNIRGSSGYSRGVGSRVIMLLDGVPFIAGDTQGMIFEALAMNQIERIEVLKGAGSALYGSSAIGGVINVITRPVSEKPEFSVEAYGGMYAKPYYDEWNWSNKTQFMHGIKAGYSRKINDVGLRIAAARDRDDGYRKNDYKTRYNINAKLQYDLSAFDQITVSANYMDQSRGNFFYWKDLDNALIPPDDQLSQKVHSVRYYVMPAYRKAIDPGSYLKIKSIWFHNYFKDNIGDPGNESTSDFFHVDVQYGLQAGRHLLTVGLVPSYNMLSSNIFGSRNGLGLAVYAQDELSFSDRWILTLGGRFDYYDIDALGSDNSVNPKLGLVFKPAEGAALRFSAGTGFRAPSMAEAFTSTSTGGIVVVPNENLKAERSVSAEIGWRQMYSAYLASDVALFYSKYQDLIEGGFLPSGNIQFQNVTEARIAGGEINLNFQPLLKRVFINLGYTFLDPRDLSINDYLKYRPRHLLYLNGIWRFSIWSLEMDYRFISRYDRIDENFAAVIPDAEVRGDAHVVDVRLQSRFNWNKIPVRFSLQINNLLQYHYIDLIGSIAPIRNYVFTFGLEL